MTLEEEKFCKPDKYDENGDIKTYEMKPASYDKLDPETGIVRLNEYVTEKDVIIGKVIPLKTDGTDVKFKDNSTTIKVMSLDLLTKYILTKILIIIDLLK